MSAFSSSAARLGFRPALVVSLVVALGCVAARAAFAAGPPWIAKSDPIRIMALGDSITAGVGARGVDTGDGGYRAALTKLLDAEGYRYEMTGTRSDFSANMARAREHEGWPGYVIRSFPSDPGHELLGAVTRNAMAQDDPDVILLMAGTNDLLRGERHSAGYTVPNIVGSMDALLDQIFSDKPAVDVILAGVVDSPYVSDCTVKRFDGVDSWGCDSDDGPNLMTLVEKYRDRGFHIALASRMDAAVPRDREHFPDGIHPSGLGGYAKMARVWMNAIEDETVPPDGLSVSATAPQIAP